MVLWRPTRPSRTNTPKRCPFHYRGLECKSRKSRNTWSNRQIWPWNTEWSRAKANRVFPRECTGHSKHPLPTTQFKSISAFFTVQLSHPYMTTGKTIALTRQTFIGKVISLLFNMLSRLVIIFLPRSKRLLISWLHIWGYWYFSRQSWFQLVRFSWCTLHIR